MVVLCVDIFRKAVLRADSRHLRARAFLSRTHVLTHIRVQYQYRAWRFERIAIHSWLIRRIRQFGRPMPGAVSIDEPIERAMLSNFTPVSSLRQLLRTEQFTLERYSTQHEHVVWPYIVLSTLGVYHGLPFAVLFKMASNGPIDASLVVLAVMLAWTFADTLFWFDRWRRIQYRGDVYALRYAGYEGYEIARTLKEIHTYSAQLLRIYRDRIILDDRVPLFV